MMDDGRSAESRLVLYSLKGASVEMNAESGSVACYAAIGNAADGGSMIANAAEEQERKVAHATLVRLANSCERAAARGRSVAPVAADLDEEDYRTIADILRRMADMVER